MEASLTYIGQLSCLYGKYIEMANPGDIFVTGYSHLSYRFVGTECRHEKWYDHVVC